MISKKPLKSLKIVIRIFATKIPTCKDVEDKSNNCKETCSNVMKLAICISATINNAKLNWKDAMITKIFATKTLKKLQITSMNVKMTSLTTKEIVKKISYLWTKSLIGARSKFNNQKRTIPNWTFLSKTLKVNCKQLKTKFSHVNLKTKIV